MAHVHEMTPIPITPRVRNVLIALAVVALVLVAWLAPTVPQLILSGAALALVLSFPVRLLSRLVPRGIAILVVVVALLIAVAAALIVLIPIVIGQIASLADATPALAAEADARFRLIADELSRRGLIEETPDEAVQSLQRQIVDRAEGFVQQAGTTVLGSLTGVAGFAFQMIGILLVAVYLLADVNRFKGAFVRALPAVYRDDAEELWNDVGQTLSRYLGGILISLTFQGTVSTLVLWQLGVPYPVLLGLWTAVGAIVPVVGSYIGGVPATLVAFFVSPGTAVLTILLYVVLNVVDGNLIAPRVQGRALRVHPLLIFLAVIAGSQVAGLWGAVIAVPLLAIVRALIEFFGDRLVVVERVNWAAARSQQPIAQPISAQSVAVADASLPGAVDPVVVVREADPATVAPSVTAPVTPPASSP